jgi:hypothetical protein
VFYDDTTGMPMNTLAVAPVSGFSTTTLLIIGVVALLLFKGMNR